jgi:hypothetical protein
LARSQGFHRISEVGEKMVNSDIASINAGSYVEVTFRGYVVASGKDFIFIGSAPNEDDYTVSYDEIGVDIDSFKDALIKVLPTPFPTDIASVIVHDDTRVVLVRNGVGDWIDLDSNLIYAEEDLGSFDDYHLKEDES